MGLVKTQEAQREATATIRGYIYQFEASILAILAAAADETITLEGVEDFDISAPTTETYSQVKYYEAQKLTDATLRDAILPMLQGFMRYTADVRERKRYVLYGHFRDTPTAPARLMLDDLKRILVQRSYPKDEFGEKTRIEVNLQDQLEATDEDLQSFASRLSIRISEPIDQHRIRVIAELASTLGISEVEAQGYGYPSALTKVSTISMERSPEARTTTRTNFLQSVKPNVAIYSAWALREEGETAFCQKIKNLHFKNLNIESRDRFFILTLSPSDGLPEAFALVQQIIAGWSSHKIKRKPDKERYAPFFFFPDMGTDDIAQLKGRLFEDGHTITDGHAYQGAPFSVRHLLTPQTQDRPISARFVSSSEQLSQALSAAQLRKQVIQLHTGAALHVDHAIPQIAIPIRDASMARKIL
jgi:hypothetical protein